MRRPPRPLRYHRPGVADPGPGTRRRASGAGRDTRFSEAPLTLPVHPPDLKVGRDPTHRKYARAPAHSSSSDTAPQAAPHNQYGRKSACAITETSDGIGPERVSAM